jgi:hypothetical protein
MLAHASVTQGERNIAPAWLATATDHYNHGVLGDEIGAATVAARLQNGDVLRYDLPADSVFEDLTLRLYDIDGDGDTEIILVRSNLYDGAAVSGFPVGATGLEVFAEAYPIGLTHRWISPMGAANFDGDGAMEVAAMMAPHLQGVLNFYNR